jgi:hypothetical protein
VDSNSLFSEFNFEHVYRPVVCSFEFNIRCHFTLDTFDIFLWQILLLYNLYRLKVSCKCYIEISMSYTNLGELFLVRIPPYK